MFYVFVLVCSLLAEAVVGGKKVLKRTFPAPFAVRLISEHSICTASLIGEGVALTAAHCVDGVEGRQAIMFGHNGKKNQLRLVTKKKIFPNWKVKGDLALAFFEGDIPAPYDAVDLGEIDGSQQSSTIVGAGVKNGAKESGAGVMRVVDLEVKGLVNRTLVALQGESGESACFGDSGGPAIQEHDGKWIQWGVASSVTDSACEGYSIYTRVAPYMKWIQKNLQ